MKICLGKDFSDVPGARFIRQGDNSAELFRDTILVPKLIEAVYNDVTLEVNLDGTAGCCASFLEEVFGGLIRRNVIDIVWILRCLVITSEERMRYDEQSYTYLIQQIHRKLNEENKDN